MGVSPIWHDELVLQSHINQARRIAKRSPSHSKNDRSSHCYHTVRINIYHSSFYLFSSSCEIIMWSCVDSKMWCWALLIRLGFGCSSLFNANAVPPLLGYRRDSCVSAFRHQCINLRPAASSNVELSTIARLLSHTTDSEAIKTRSRRFGYCTSIVPGQCL